MLRLFVPLVMASSLSPQRLVRSISQRLRDEDSDLHHDTMGEERYYDLTFDSNKKKGFSKLPNINMNFFTEPHRYDDVAKNEYDPQGEDETLEAGEVNDHDERMELVDEEAISIMSKRRSRARRAKRTMCGLVCVSMVLIVSGVLLNAVRTNHIDITKFIPTFRASTTNEDRVRKACDPDTIDNKREDCREACLVASCCHAQSKADNCYGEFPDFCSEFIACNVLHDGPDIPSDASIAAPPSDLDHQCHPTRLNTSVDATQACKLACGSATCCFPSAKEDSCFIGNQLVCSEYSACKHLFDEVVGPPVVEASDSTSPIAKACGDDPAQRPECERLCESYQCCFENGPCDDASMCSSGWGDPCAILYNKSTDYGIITEQIQASCGPDVDLSDPDARASCEQDCEDAQECCMMQPLNAKDCTTGAECDAYAGCKRLNDDEPSSLEDHVFDLCERRDLTDSIDRAACADLCKVAECCYEPDHPNSCRMQDWCESYGGCLNLLTTAEASQSDGMKLTGRINRLCADISHVDGLDDCLEICLPSECCFDASISCSDDLQLGCSPYASCQVLMGTTDFASGDEHSPQELEDGMQLTGKVNRLCKDISFTSARQDCLDVCEPSGCCFNSELKCADELMMGCDAYSSCHVLVGTTDFAGLNDDNDDGLVDDQGEFDDDEEDGMQVTAKVNKVCNDIKYPTAREDCIDVCKPAECCFNNNIQCSDDLIGCDPYTSCHVLVGTTQYAKTEGSTEASTGDAMDGITTLTGKINRVCNDIKYPTARQDCLDACHEGECCFNSAIPCGSDDLNCDAYASCHVLVGSTHYGVGNGEVTPMEHTEDPKTVVANKVSRLCADITDPTHKENCMDVCRPSECCFNNAISCPSDLIGCDAYSGCQILVDQTQFAHLQSDDDDQVKEMAEEDRVNELCADVSDAAAHEACTSVCVHAECCFNEQLACPDDLVECDAYQACKVLPKFSSPPPTAPEDVTRACADVSTPQGQQDCTTACVHAECCFKDDIECGDLDCEPYAACEILSKFASLTPTHNNGGTAVVSEQQDAMLLTGKVNKVCGDVKYPTAQEDCIDACRPAECCFNDAISCPNDLIGCDPYAACGVLVGKTQFATTGGQ